MTTPRKGQAPDFLPRDEFAKRFRQSFHDPAFDAEKDALDRIEKIAWGAYKDERKSPRTEKAGPGFKDPQYDLSVEWAATRRRLQAAEAVQKSAASTSRVLVICGSARNDGSCPGEVSKTWRLSKLAIEVLQRAKVEADLLDLSQLTSEYGKRIHPCKACVSTAQPLCHWPCSCYPNYALNQVGDWMNDIYERWVAAHAVILLTPVNWYHSSSPVKLMIDRLVCADGGNPDPTSTRGKDAKLAKKIELKGWDYPKHLAGRAYGIVVHGDVAGTDDARKALSDWLDWMGLIDAGNAARLDRYIGYYEPYATSHESLDDDKDVQEEVRNVARAVVNAVHQLREGRLKRLDEGLERPRPK
jgi:multimeric flavodoxin WrbA